MLGGARGWLSWFVERMDEAQFAVTMIATMMEAVVADWRDHPRKWRRRWGATGDAS
jgi:hypothetical protein